MPKFLSAEYLQQQQLWLKARQERRREVLASLEDQEAVQKDEELLWMKYALIRIESGQYGICTHCGIIQEEDFIASQPESPFFSRCAEEVELERRQK